ncbi:pyridoxal-phosphate dependent enzyme [Paraburkholderia sp. 5N]|uniref:Pyridoxal-phosphate dependent enzyme n=2 Tax=Paraburkholderia elongata TaxID=2675747 RepID=A0A972NKS4_9BURK|nr:pyridoxal-phosphate dependent enzyme [Paraburkholderia elongata]
MAMNEIPRARLGSFPTPCEQASDLGAVLGVDALWVKRDDLTGYSWGGNKVRPIEFILGDALHQGADTVVVCGGPTSNFAALMVAACSQRGLAVHHVSYGQRPSRIPAAFEVSIQSGAVVEFTGSSDRETMDATAEVVASRLRAQGKRPYVLPRGGASAVGALGFANAALELSAQLKQLGIDAITVVVPVGSGGTIAGLITGWTYALDAGSLTDALDVEIVGVSVSRPPDEMRETIESVVRGCGATAAESVLRPLASRCRWRLVDGRSAGFGVADVSDIELVEEISRQTRFLVDTTYNGKAMRWIRESASQLSRPVVYWHTGGTLGVVDRFSGRSADWEALSTEECKQ